MTEQMRTIIDNFHRYSTDHLAALTFGLSEETAYDALVAAPSFVPYKILDETEWEIEQTGRQGFCAGWEARRDGKTLAWIKTASGGGNLSCLRNWHRCPMGLAARPCGARLSPPEAGIEG